MPPRKSACARPRSPRRFPGEADHLRRINGRSMPVSAGIVLHTACRMRIPVRTRSMRKCSRTTSVTIRTPHDRLTAPLEPGQPAPAPAVLTFSELHHRLCRTDSAPAMCHPNGTLQNGVAAPLWTLRPTRARMLQRLGSRACPEHLLGILTPYCDSRRAGTRNRRFRPRSITYSAAAAR